MVRGEATPQWERILRRHCTAMKISDNLDDTTHIHTQKEGEKREIKNAHLGLTTRCGVNMSGPPHTVRGICEVPIMQSSLLHHNGPPQQLALEARITSCAQSADTSYQKNDGISVILFFFSFLVCRHITASVSLGMKTVHGKDEPKVTPTNRWAQPARLPWRGHLPLLPS